MQAPGELLEKYNNKIKFHINYAIWQTEHWVTYVQQPYIGVITDIVWDVKVLEIHLPGRIFAN